jgi:nicotinamide mononucleotide (NMN) deamidase PncC
VITTPVDNTSVNLGTLSSFAMWSSNGAVSDVGNASTTGDVGTAVGILTIAGPHTGEEYPAGSVGASITNDSTTTYSIYVNGTEVPNSRRTIKIKEGLVYLQAMITVASDNIPVELRWKVDKGSATLKNRIFSLNRF